MTFYTFNQHNGPDFALGGYSLDAFERHATAKDAALTVLGYDCRGCGIEEDADGFFVPWRRRMSGHIERLTNLRGLTEDEAIQNVIDSPHFDIECVSEEVARGIIKDATAE